MALLNDLTSSDRLLTLTLEPVVADTSLTMAPGGNLSVEVSMPVPVAVAISKDSLSIPAVTAVVPSNDVPPGSSSEGTSAQWSVHVSLARVSTTLHMVGSDGSLQVVAHVGSAGIDVYESRTRRLCRLLLERISTDLRLEGEGGTCAHC